jgi:hypothetical protein
MSAGRVQPSACSAGFHEWRADPVPPIARCHHHQPRRDPGLDRCLSSIRRFLTTGTGSQTASHGARGGGTIAAGECAGAAPARARVACHQAPPGAPQAGSSQARQRDARELAGCAQGGSTSSQPGARQQPAGSVTAQVVDHGRHVRALTRGRVEREHGQRVHGRPAVRPGHVARQRRRRIRAQRVPGDTLAAAAGGLYHVARTRVGSVAYNRSDVRSDMIAGVGPGRRVNLASRYGECYAFGGCPPVASGPMARGKAGAT